jgi:hypothetical protein
MERYIVFGGSLNFQTSQLVGYLTCMQDYGIVSGLGTANIPQLWQRNGRDFLGSVFGDDAEVRRFYDETLANNFCPLDVVRCKIEDGVKFDDLKSQIFDRFSGLKRREYSLECGSL